MIMRPHWIMPGEVIFQCRRKTGELMSGNTAKPVIIQIKDNKESLDAFEKSLSQESKKIRKMIGEFPTVYIHAWREKGKYEVYVGESNDIFKRTRQHYEAASDRTKWQSRLEKRDAVLFVIGHEHFHKSMTLDIENRLMHTLMSVESVRRVHNLRENPQTSYYLMEETDGIFREIWRMLGRKNKELFPSESEIRDSAIYKASPFHKLTDDQKHARDRIMEMVSKILKNRETKQLIFIDGEAGTGKTVLVSSTFYELYCQAEEEERELMCHLLVNHDEQITVYEQIAEKLGLTEKYGTVVSKPTTFINHHSAEAPVDVAFVDEAHLLLTQGKQSYRGENQLADIMERARVTVVLFDENQILTTEQFWEAQVLEEYRMQAEALQNHIVLTEQLRMHADAEVMDWIDSFTKRGELKNIPEKPDGYCIRVFDSPEALDSAIRKRAKEKESALSRVTATYDWEYREKQRPKDPARKYWEVRIGAWHKPWNRELKAELSREEKKQIDGLAWAEQPQTIHEVGSTFTIQVFDLNYAGVILGPSVKYRNGRIVFDPSASCNAKAVRNRTLSDGTKRKFGETLIRHEVRVLMTRGVNGLYLYACDPELQTALLKAAEEGRK